MKTTLRKIRANKPCKEGWKKLLSNVNNDLNAPLDFREILKSNGIEDTVWVLDVVDNEEDKKKILLFNADIAESILDIFENQFSKDKRPHEAIQAIRDYATGMINKEELIIKKRTASAAGYTAYTAVNAAYAYDAAAYLAADNEAKWEEIEKILLKYI